MRFAPLALGLAAVTGLAAPPPKPSGWLRRAQDYGDRASSERIVELARLTAIKSARDAGQLCDNGDALEIADIRLIGGPQADIYGEIAPKGMAELFGVERLALTVTDQFAGLGSGIGKAVVMAAADFGVLHSTGVELSATRHAAAVASLSARADVELTSRVTLLQGDCAGDEVSTRYVAPSGILLGYLCLLAACVAIIASNTARLPMSSS